jgi:hypothetical protein
MNLLEGPPNATVDANDPLGLVQARLIADFPSVYGGIYANADGSFTINEVTASVSLQTEANSLWATLPSSYNSSAQAPQLSFAIGARPLASLYQIQETIWSQVSPGVPSATAATMSGILSASIDEKNDQVVIQTTLMPGQALATPTPQSEEGLQLVNSVASQYGDAVRFEVTIHLSGAPSDAIAVGGP